MKGRQKINTSKGLVSTESFLISLCLFSFWFLEFLSCCRLSGYLTEVIFNFSNGLNYFVPTLFPNDYIHVVLLLLLLSRFSRVRLCATRDRYIYHFI